jgi:signal peptidase I
MESTLLPGDFLLVNKFIYGLKTPRHLPLTNIRIPSIGLLRFRAVHRGDVVVFEFPGYQGQTIVTEPTNFVKRCIGLPGDTVLIKNGVVLVNGMTLTLPKTGKPEHLSRFQDWNRGRLFPRGSDFTDINYGPLFVPTRGTRITLDAKNLQQWEIIIAREGHDVQVEADTTVLIDGAPASSYVLEHDYYFFMGDNRGSSNDSRHWGFVPDENILGRALILYWSWDSDIDMTNGTEKARSIRWNRLGTIIE